MGQAGHGVSNSAPPTLSQGKEQSWGPGSKARLPPAPHFPPAPVPRSCCEQEEPTYFAIWGDNKAFNEVIISPAMLHEHLPYVVMEGLHKVSWGGAGPGPLVGAP